MPTDPYAYAAALCARRECCRTEIIAKLQSREVAPDEAEAMADRLADEGYLDDGRYARAFVADKYRFDHWGRVKMRYALRQKGIAAADINAALDAIDEGEYRQALTDFLEAKLRTAGPVSADDPQACFKLRQKLLRAAANRGYEVALIMELLPDPDL